jgi:hypothetical protein
MQRICQTVGYAGRNHIVTTCGRIGNMGAILHPIHHVRRFCARPLQTHQNTMKANTTIIVTVLLCGIISASYGESVYERELKQLIEQRDKAIAAASAPITARFNTSAEQLLKRATQNGDLDAANKIKAAIGDGVPTQGATPPVGPIKDLKRELAGTTWIILPNTAPKGGLTDKLTFTDKVVEPGSYKYEATHNSVVVTFNKGGTQALELTRDGRHLQYPKGAVAYELATPK